jgi:pyruvate-formate lyase-activating enzyme
LLRCLFGVARRHLASFARRAQMTTEPFNDPDRSREPHSGKPGGGERPLSPTRAQAVALSFACNNRCTTCLLGEMRGSSTRMSAEEFERLVEANRRERRFDRLALSGAEVTLDETLVERIAHARRSGAYRHIRLQSNGRRFCDRAFVEELIDAGVDEFYVSVRAHEPGLDRRITGRAESFEEMRRGLEVLASIGATLITNTVMHAWNVESLAEIAELVCGYGPARVELWGFVPVAPHHRDLMAPLDRLLPNLNRALDVALSGPRDAAVTWIPRCVLADRDGLYEPPLREPIIDERFWRSFPAFACFYEGACAAHPGCRGLPLPYVERFGYATGLLKPYPHAGGRAPNRRVPGGTRRSGNGEATWREMLLGPDGRFADYTSLWRLESVRQRNRRVDLRLTAFGSYPVDLVLEPRDDGRQCHARTKGLNVSLIPAGPERPTSQQQNRLLFTLLPILTRNDDGSAVFP